MKKPITILGRLFNSMPAESKGIPAMKNIPPPPPPKEKQTESFVMGSASFSPWYPVSQNVPFDGEKTEGELGMPINLIPMPQALRLRAYEAELKSDVVKIITGRFFKWVVGNGLKLQAEPNKTVLETEGITDDLTNFRKHAEARFEVYANSTFSDFQNMVNLHERAEEAFRTAFLGGDCLIILRYENKLLNVQVIDGQEIVNPDKKSYYDDAKAKNHIIESGIERNARGEHIAFFVRMQVGAEVVIERIQAKGEKSNKTFAWMLYGTKHRINHSRGISQISSILEKVNKLDRYTEASVSSAEERAKIVFAIEHNQFSTGENPVIENMRRNLAGEGELEALQNSFDLAEETTKNIKLTTNKQTFNMPVGSKITALDSNQELQYEPFFKGVFVQLCAAVDIPPEVALQQYSSNYSASRAAINGWGYIVDIYRKKFSDNFYRKIYSLWLHLEILNNKISAPSYLKAVREENVMALESYYSCRFTGVNMPHIDPLKEVKAIREMLGNPAEGVPPLIGLDKASELLNQGDWIANITKYLEEITVIQSYLDAEKEKANPAPTESTKKEEDDL